MKGVNSKDSSLFWMPGKICPHGPPCRSVIVRAHVLWLVLSCNGLNIFTAFKFYNSNKYCLSMLSICHLLPLFNTLYSHG